MVGAPLLLRTSIKHEARSFAPWIAIATVLSASSVLVYPWVFPTEADREGLATLVGSNPALGLIFGPAFDVSTADGFNAWRTLALGGLLTALGAIFVVTKATRGQEDSGQAELLASGVLGRSSRLLTAVAMGLIMSIIVGIVAAVVTLLCGGGTEATLLLCATYTATGWMGTGFAAVTSQLGAEARASSSMAVGVMGVLFILRGFTYSVEAADWALWINPLAWMTETKPAVENNWWPLWLAVALTLVLLVVAFALQARRDFGQGAIAPAPGPARGRARTPLALALKLNRGTLIVWATGFAVLGVVFGYFTTAITDLLAGDSGIGQVLASGAQSPADVFGAFVATVVNLIGIFASIACVQIILRVRKEEMDDRVEPLIATPTSRARYYASNVVVAMGAAVAFLVIAGVIVAGFASSADIGVTYGQAFGQALATIPAVWTVIAVAVAVVGARPKVSIAAWAGVLLSFGLTLLGPTFGLDDWVLAISPFYHVPAVATSTVEWAGLGVVFLVGAALVTVGFAGFRRRDLATT
ncbi:ABC transporter permease [Demequina gelatinilytica]|uniref:ABC transporter permease n=1 Tax=Demequina gelatinilytica TaxID=1638980 RepID=UPI001E2A54CE|nr:ABC transporter permease [Demequina gelatinilytica]